MDDHRLFDLSGKVALVTGGSRGLGREMVWAFARAGADVAIASRKLDACEDLAREVRSVTGREALAVACHVGDWDQVGRLAETTFMHFGKIDVLVNNAGLSPIYDHVSNVSEALYDKVLDVNLKGPFRLSAIVGTRMAQGDGGSIIFVSSTASQSPGADTIPYGAAKAGINNMTLGFARAFAPKVRVNCIVPGPFLTDISKAWDMDAFNRTASKSILLRRAGEPREIVGAALYFASDASTFTTGSQLVISGGSASG
jgi:NAD(P)-dependent dehydrogenase (short-subunit alcohol dehydrogenase family)